MIRQLLIKKSVNLPFPSLVKDLAFQEQYDLGKKQLREQMQVQTLVQPPMQLVLKERDQQPLQIHHN